MGTGVHIKEEVVISPSRLTPSQVLPLSALDSQLFLRFTCEYLLVFRNPCPRPTDRDSTVSRLKAALSNSLVPYYPLAGRVRSNSDDDSGLELAFHSLGAVWIEAVADQTVVEDFLRAPRYVEEWRKLLALQVEDVLGGAPVLVVQLTWLEDGNAALAVGMNHCVCDGIGSAEFLNSFAEFARLDTVGGSEFRTQPVWDRRLFNPTASSPRNFVAATADHPEFERFEDTCGFVARFSSERLIPTSTIFDECSLAELKRTALSAEIREADEYSSSFTSFEVLSAHVWRSWTRSLNLPPNQSLKMLFSVNVRNRVNPRIPEGYYGNAFVLGCVQATVKDLMEKELGFVAGLVKRAKEKVDGEYVKRVVDMVSGGGVCPDRVGVLILSQWSRLGLERVDFGMGTPVHVGVVCCYQYCTFLPVHGQGAAVKVMVALPSTAAEEFERLVSIPCGSNDDSSFDF